MKQRTSKNQSVNNAKLYAEMYSLGVAFAMNENKTKMAIRDIAMAYESGYEYALEEHRRETQSHGSRKETKWQRDEKLLAQTYALNATRLADLERLREAVERVNAQPKLELFHATWLSDIMPALAKLTPQPERRNDIRRSI